jgi:hypothetical protein
MASEEFKEAVNKLSALSLSDGATYFETIKDCFSPTQQQILQSCIATDYHPGPVQIVQGTFQRPPSAMAVFQAAIYMAGATQGLIKQFRRVKQQTIQRQIKDFFNDRDMRSDRLPYDWTLDLVILAHSIFDQDLKNDPHAYDNMLAVDIGKMLLRSAMKLHIKDNTDAATDSIVNQRKTIPVASASDIVAAARDIAKQPPDSLVQQPPPSVGLGWPAIPEEAHENPPAPPVSDEERAAMDKLFG